RVFAKPYRFAVPRGTGTYPSHVPIRGTGLQAHKTSERRFIFIPTFLSFCETFLGQNISHTFLLDYLCFPKRIDQPLNQGVYSLTWQMSGFGAKRKSCARPEHYRF